ncbi:MAG: hypothetical protein ABL970_10775 [Nitrospira sp.]
MRADKKTPLKADKKVPPRGHKRGVIGYSKKSALLEDAITQMNAGKYGRSSAALKELLALDPLNMEARRLFATLHLRLGSLLPARQAFESLANEALERQDYWLAESLLREYLVAGPRCVPFIEKLGLVHQEKGDALAASEEFAKAIDILIEDPDPDRPTRPAELYAKIRELAPASPPAFRLATLFDTQSGDLIAHAPVVLAPQPEEPLPPPVAVEESAPPASTLSTPMPDPVSGVMPWDEVPAGSPTLPAQSFQPVSSDQLASSTATLSEPIAEFPVASAAPLFVSESSATHDAISEPAPVELSSRPSFEISNSDSSFSVALPDAASTRLSVTHEEMPGTDGGSTGPEWGVASLSIPQDSGDTTLSETISTAEAGQSPQSDLSNVPAGSTSDPLPAPMPWEQVQDATVVIPQPDVEPLMVNLSSVEPIPAVLPELVPSEPTHTQDSEGPELAELSVPAGAGTTLSSGTTQEFSPDVAWSAPDVPATEPVGFSSIAPESSLTSSVAEEPQPDVVIESVPLPWEQVQESSVSIEASGQEPSSLQSETVGSSPVQLQEASPAETGSRIAPEAIATSLELGGPESQDALSAPTAGVPTQLESPSISSQSPKVGEFSWASIFNSTWKFGSSSPAPHDSLHHASPIELSVSAESGVPQETASIPVPSEELTAGPLSDASAVEGHGEAVSSPMPWDQIQDLPVTIPSADVAMSSLIAPQVVSVETCDHGTVQDASVSVLVPEEELTAVIRSAETSESIPASASQPEPVASPLPWEQIQDTSVSILPAEMVPNAPAVSFGEFSVASVEPPENELGQDVPLVAPVLQEELTTSIPSSDVPASMPVSARDEEPAASPMSGNLPQETLVTIPPAEIALSSVVESLMEPPADVPAEFSEDRVTQDAMTSLDPVESPAVSASALVEEGKPIEVAQVASAELSFRFADSKSTAASSIQVPQPQPPTLPNEQTAAVRPAMTSSQAEELSAGGSDEFRIASQTEPVPVVQETIRLDAPVLSAESAPAGLASTEPAPPVLPHELLPVLQTLVDQLSVVTKTIPATSSETKSFEPSSHDAEVVSPPASLREPSQAPSSAELAANPSSAQMPPTEAGPPSQWKTGEVAVQTHRPSAKKRKHSSEPAPEPPSLPVEAQPVSPVETVSPLVSTIAEPMVSAAAPVKEKDEWIRTGEAIRFIDPKANEPAHLSPPPPVVQSESPATSPVQFTAASAVDVLFHSSGPQTRTQTIDRTAAPKPRPQLSAKLARVRISLSVFVGSCFSTTRALVMSIVGLAVLCVAMLAVAIGAVGLTWLAMEEKPSPAFQSLTTTPQRTMMDSSKNGYLLLLGFEADGTADPVQAGYERKPDAKDGGMAAVCQGGDEGMTGANQKNASASVAQGWYRSTDPTGQFKTQTDNLKGWMSQANVSVGRYRQWLKMPFEDWGHGQAVTPPCAAILFAHRLHVAEGFSQGASMEAGVERLEGDMEAWRTTLGQAKTLPVKMMALQAINDDIAVASGLLVKPDFDSKNLPRITKMLRPLDPVESSMRWPMQSQLVLATRSYAAQLDADRGEDVPFHVAVASMLPLPKQRRFNDYAEYYEASYKAAGEGRYGAMPKRTTYIKHPVNGVMDYVTNPIENIIGVDPLPAWDHYNGLVIDTDAHLRLASLQAWLRRGPQDADLLARIAKAGQRLYDPYTGLPMLVNLRQGVMYSVGHDGKDQDADPQQDVVVSIPLNPSSPTIPKPAPKAK